MSHPPRGVRLGKDGQLHVAFVNGLYICVLEGYSVVWNRDINAPINQTVHTSPPPRWCCTRR